MTSTERAAIKAIINLLEATLLDIPSRTADKMVAAAIEALKSIENVQSL